MINQIKHTLTRVDLAVDVDHPQPITAAAYVSSKLVLKHTKSATNQFIVGNGTYARRKSSARNLVVYGDKLSKVTGRPVVHIELRLKGTRALKGLEMSVGRLVERVDVVSFLRGFLRCSNEYDKLLKCLGNQSNMQDYNSN